MIDNKGNMRVSDALSIASRGERRESHLVNRTRRVKSEQSLNKKDL